MSLFRAATPQPTEIIRAKLSLIHDDDLQLIPPLGSVQYIICCFDMQDYQLVSGTEQIDKCSHHVTGRRH